MKTELLTVTSPSKINLFLEVVRKRPDGFHDIDSVFQELAFADELGMAVREDGAVELECSFPGVPLDANNTVVKALEALRSVTGVKSGMRVRLKKNIPPQAGLGGGSGNAAAALVGANALWRCGLSREELAAIAAAVGADVPFFLHGGTCVCTGRGEIIVPIAAKTPRRPITLVLSALRSNTAEAYAGLSLPEPGMARDSNTLVARLCDSAADALAAAAFNRFEQTVFAALPLLGELHARLAAIPGLTPRLSGSGPSLWFFDTADLLRGALARDKELRDLCDKISVRLVETTTSNQGLAMRREGNAG